MLIKNKPVMLIVDDDTSISRVFSRIFQKNGFSVTVANNGKEAIEKLHTQRFDVALIDFCLPDMEGAELFPLIEKSSPKTVKIMLTGKIHMKNRVKGADEFLGKPINPEKLLSIVDTKLKLKNIEA